MKFTIHGTEWRILLVPPLSDCLRRSDGSFTVGVSDQSTGCICLSESLCGAFRRKVLIHEICHAVCMSYDIHIPLEQEEVLCDFVAAHGDEVLEIADRMLAILGRAA